MNRRWIIGKKMIEFEVVDVDRPGSVHRAHVRAAEQHRVALGQLEQVGPKRLLVVEVENDVADHRGIVTAVVPAVTCPDRPGSGVVKSMTRLPLPPECHADPDPGEVGVHQIAVVTAVVRPLALVEEVRGKDRCVRVSTPAADVLAPVGCRIARAPQSVVRAAVRDVAALPGLARSRAYGRARAIEIPESSLTARRCVHPGSSTSRMTSPSRRSACSS